MHEPRDLERDSLTNWQPVQLPQHWCDVVATTGACNQASGNVLHRLKALYVLYTYYIRTQNEEKLAFICYY